jgi:hypothetical protein
VKKLLQVRPVSLWLVLIHLFIHELLVVFLHTMFVTPVGFVHVQFILNCHADLCKFVGSHSLFVLQLAFHQIPLQLQVHGPVHDTAVAVHAVHSSPHDGAFILVLPFAVPHVQGTCCCHIAYKFTLFVHMV